MTFHRTTVAFVAIALLAAATTAAAMRPHAPDAEREFAGVMAPKPVPEIKKPVRYETIISNWKRYRSTAKSSG
ncbi:hypothetical protein [Bradyrhizobium sp.]|jgi:hypothetical protein|uniref:hypothetical protein n=1 Tax=Bradyrhizobium sp. TaxID=376 RepID=UPI002E0339D6|nr:hypothetical protein [Bradyrhizobium sp.]